MQLPGQILVGEGKPNNQNHAIIFTRGEAIQAIDMNQDAALEDAVKIRQVREAVHKASTANLGSSSCFVCRRVAT